MKLSSRSMLFALALGACVFAAPHLSQASMLTLNSPSNNPLVFSGTTTDTLSAFNFVTVRGNVSRFWFFNTGFATNDVTNRLGPPYRTNVVIFCNNLLANWFQSGTTSNSVIANNILNVSCPAGQFASATHHYAYAD
jgi:hypothetical protein